MSDLIKAAELRARYMREGLRGQTLDADPYRQFEKWYTQVLNSDIPEPTAMVLATVDAAGQPWQRTVLLKVFDTQGFVFFTNYGSRKATHIATEARVSLLFPWHALGRQVKITGEAGKISTAESLRYFATRSRGSQIGAWASPQSQVIKSRSFLDSVVEEMRNKFSHGEIPLPHFWGGYRVRPRTIEFWQGREDRLHDRFIYTLDEAHTWKIERLAP